MHSPTPAQPLRILVAPDSFKGSLTARDAARTIAEGLTEALGPHAVIQPLPIADGGDGTLDVVVDAVGARLMSVPTVDALGRPRDARVGLLPNGYALVEAAEANGIMHVSDVDPRPLEASSTGVGLMVRAALESGATGVLLTVGGSASTDGGAGLLRALGVRFLDVDDHELVDGGAAMRSLARIDLTGMLPAARSARWRIACDVDNPLIGPSGAAAVFGPQKGADPDDVTILDDALGRLASVLQEETGVDVRHLAGGGAAGGIPATLHAVFGAELCPGMELVAEALDVAGAIAESDLVVTGEGSLDEQSLRGKVPGAIAALAHEAGVPVVVIAGSVALTPEQLSRAGIAAAFPLADGEATLEELLRRAPELLRDAAARLGVRLRLNLAEAQPSTVSVPALPGESLADALHRDWPLGTELLGEQ